MCLLYNIFNISGITVISNEKTLILGQFRNSVTVMEKWTEIKVGFEVLIQRYDAKVGFEGWFSTVYHVWLNFDLEYLKQRLESCSLKNKLKYKQLYISEII